MLKVCKLSVCMISMWNLVHQCHIQRYPHVQAYDCWMICVKVLQDKREAPQLPASYSVMALLAMVPIAFFTVMNPRAIKAVQVHTDLEQS